MEGRPDLNHPPTARYCPWVGFAVSESAASGRWDLNNPHTAVWGIQKRFGKVALVGGI